MFSFNCFNVIGRHDTPLNRHEYTLNQHNELTEANGSLSENESIPFLYLVEFQFVDNTSIKRP